ncbi:sulfite exporter TauE/SafE family protein [Myxococcota bacterium]|nr:sulfite exporter TauE/SafE family protein [Myxococcota bacterium]
MGSGGECEPRNLQPIDATDPSKAMEPLHVISLIGGGVLAGVFNTLAGGGSLITVPVLVLLGLPGAVANGTNRIGILFQSLAATWQFRAEGVHVTREALGVLAPACVGAALGAQAAVWVSHDTFEWVFGVLMLVLIVPTLWDLGPKPGSGQRPGWSRPARTAIFLAIGAYGGAFQAGVGIFLLLALDRTGYDLISANAIKLIVVAGLTLFALPVFLWNDQIRWLPGLVLAGGYSLGGALGARIAVRGGERIVRLGILFAVLVLSGRMLGLY